MPFLLLLYRLQVRHMSAFNDFVSNVKKGMQQKGGEEPKKDEKKKTTKTASTASEVYGDHLQRFV